ncbi:MAG: two-component system, NarL family, sensor kinase [Solirubrobacteraceae bacterium]|nr:two-component system, NarL family, sensor kinase [Solirubrobacteraceae bacterium]
MPERADRPAGLTAALAVCLVADLVGVWLGWDADAWRPVWLLVLLAAVGAGSEAASIELGGYQVSSTALALVLAAVLLGPVPAAAIGLLTWVGDMLARKPTTWARWINLATSVGYPLAGGAAFEFAEDLGLTATPQALVLTVFTLAFSMNLLSFTAIAGFRWLYIGEGARGAFRDVFRPLMPYHLVAATIAAAVVYAHKYLGEGVFAALLVVLAVSEMLLRAVAKADARARESLRLAGERTLLLTQSLAAEEQERRRLGGYLHDEALQLLAVTEQELEEATGGDEQALVRGRKTLAAAVGELRRTLTHFHPEAVGAEGLRHALEAVATQLARRGGARTSVVVSESLCGVDGGLVYAVARELIANAVRHAGADRIEIMVAGTFAGVTLSVADDGAGFDMEADREPGHVGLVLTRLRVEAAGGTFELHSRSGAGTRAVATLPHGTPRVVEPVRVERLVL